MLQSFKLPRDNERCRWTRHVVRKMVHYRLTPARVMRVVRAPERLEDGIAPGTLAGMQRAGSKARPSEVWAMWKVDEKKSEVVRSKNEKVKDSTFATRTSLLPRERLVIITAWRYPGTSPVRSRVPIPDDVLSELESEGLLD